MDSGTSPCYPKPAVLRYTRKLGSNPCNKGRVQRIEGDVRKRILDGLIAVTLVLSLAALVAPASAAIIVTRDETYAAVTSGIPDFLEDTLGGTATSELTGFFSETTHDIDATGFSATFEQARLGGLFDYTAGYTFARFTADTNYSYSFSGSFTNSSGQTYLGAYLIDVTDNVNLFYNDQVNNSFDLNSDDFSFTAIVGNEDGSFYNYLEGNSTGSLIAGHDYEYRFYAYSSASDVGDLGATASGSAQLVLTPQAVPEPASLLIWSGLGLAGLVAGWRRKRI